MVKRVGAAAKIEDGKIYFLGYGNYVRDEMPEWMAPLFSGAVQQAKELIDNHLRHEEGVSQKDSDDAFVRAVNTINKKSETARIELDNGDVVWGNECYWSEEENFKRAFEDLEVVNVRIARGELGSPIGIDVIDTGERKYFYEEDEAESI